MKAKRVAQTCGVVSAFCLFGCGSRAEQPAPQIIVLDVQQTPAPQAKPEPPAPQAKPEPQKTAPTPETPSPGIPSNARRSDSLSHPFGSPPDAGPVLGSHSLDTPVNVPVPRGPPSQPLAAPAVAPCAGSPAALPVPAPCGCPAVSAPSSPALQPPSISPADPLNPSTSRNPDNVSNAIKGPSLGPVAPPAVPVVPPISPIPLRVPTGLL